MNFEHYECEGQIELEDYLKSLEKLRKKYPIPDFLDQIKSDQWNYVDEEMPKGDGIYYGISILERTYIYKYFALIGGGWHYFETYSSKWLPTDTVIAWVNYPSAWKLTDKCFTLDGFLEMRH